jgi:hypothetical protein
MRPRSATTLAAAVHQDRHRALEPSTAIVRAHLPRGFVSADLNGSICTSIAGLISPMFDRCPGENAYCLSTCSIKPSVAAFDFADV